MHCGPPRFSPRPTAAPSKLTSTDIQVWRRNFGSRRSTRIAAARPQVPAERLLLKGSNWRCRTKAAVLALTLSASEQSSSVVTFQRLVLLLGLFFVTAAPVRS